MLHVNANIFCCVGTDIMQLEGNTQFLFCKQLELLYAFLFSLQHLHTFTSLYASP